MIRSKIQANVEKGGSMVTDQKSATRVALDAVAGKTSVSEAAAVFIGGGQPPPLPSNAENTTKGKTNLPNSASPLLNFGSMGKSFFGNTSEPEEVENTAVIPDIEKVEKLDLSGAKEPPMKPPIATFTPSLPTPQAFSDQQAANSAIPDPTYTPAYFPRDGDPDDISNSADFSGYNKGTDIFKTDDDNDESDKGTNPFGTEDDSPTPPPAPPPAPPPTPPPAPPPRPPSLPSSAPSSVPPEPPIADTSSHLQEYIDPITASSSPRRTSKGLLPKMIALYDSKPEDEDELEFYKGDIIEVLEGDLEGWSKGFVRGIQGMFPTNYAEPFTE
jgi:hypothetical protein